MAVKDKLIEKQQNAPAAGGQMSIKQWITAMKPQIEKALPAVMTPDRFARIALTAVSTNPKLGECTPSSFCGAMMQAAQLGLEVNTPLGYAYLIPFRNREKMEAQFQLGYKGLIELAHRSGEFRSIEAHTVYENDAFDYEYGLEPKLHHKPALNDRGNAIAYYAVYTLTNGGFGFEVMSKEDIDAHGRKYSQSFNSSYSPWRTSYDEMAKKTVLKKVLKYAPIRIEFARQITTDNTIKTELSEDMVDLPSEPIEAEAEVVEEKAEAQAEDKPEK